MGPKQRLTMPIMIPMPRSREGEKRIGRRKPTVGKKIQRKGGLKGAPRREK